MLRHQFLSMSEEEWLGWDEKCFHVDYTLYYYEDNELVRERRSLDAISSRL